MNGNQVGVRAMFVDCRSRLDVLATVLADCGLELLPSKSVQIVPYLQAVSTRRQVFR